MTSDGKISLTILGGYLGAGKTTWLRHQLFEGGFDNVHILINEAAETPVDDTLLAAQAAGVTMLAGGCACCTGRDALISTLRELCDTRAQTGLTRIVLETSGLADPAAILDAVREDGVLVYHIKVDEIIVLVDALHATDQLDSEYLSRAQIEAADRIVLTKPDAVPAPQLAAVRATVQALNPIAQITAAAKGVGSPMDDLPEAEALSLRALDASAAPITPCRIDIPDGTDWAAFSVWLSALLYARGHDLVRVKGVMQTPAGPLLLQAVRRAVQPPEMLPPEASHRENQIVFIGRGYDSDALRRSLSFFTK
ncbi:GTP-binding protein [Sulfitobacter sp. HNIBRBA3233]|uniref:CobW family GTP-binding protein n=1 Tax=Sulfitobacter marinivivus TaxID=3158558 RepID=UPI0032DEC1E5